jgi:PAS domain-containing protein
MAAQHPGDTAPTPPAQGLAMGSLGDLGLKAIRATALRAGRLAEALFDNAMDADVIAVNDGQVWRGKGGNPQLNDADAARAVALGSETPMWVADAREEPGWMDHPSVQAEGGIRFCAAVPIRLKDGARVGVLRVLDNRPRPYDPQLAERLEDLAAMVADEGDRYLGGDTRMIRDLFDRAPGLMAVTRGPDHVIELANPALRRFVGDADLIGRRVIDALPQSGPQGFIALLDRVFATGQAQGGYARRALIYSGPDAVPRESYMDFIFQPIRDAAGEVSGVQLRLLRLVGTDVPVADIARAGRLWRRPADHVFAEILHRLA